MCASEHKGSAAVGFVLFWAQCLLFPRSAGIGLGKHFSDRQVQRTSLTTFLQCYWLYKQACQDEPQQEKQCCVDRKYVCSLGQWVDACVRSAVLRIREVDSQMLTRNLLSTVCLTKSGVPSIGARRLIIMFSGVRPCCNAGKCHRCGKADFNMCIAETWFVVPAVF